MHISIITQCRPYPNECVSFNLMTACPPGFEKVDRFKSCYKFERMPTTYYKARQYCQSMHYSAHLLQIDTTEEYSYIKGRASMEASKAHILIGCSMISHCIIQHQAKKHPTLIIFYDSIIV